MSYYIGLDGGGTKTKCIITDENLKILHECTSGPSTFLLNGTEEVSITIYNLVNECVEKIGCEFSEVMAVVIGTTGAGRRSDAERLEEDFIPNNLSPSQLLLKFHKILQLPSF